MRILVKEEPIKVVLVLSLVQIQRDACTLINVDDRGSFSLKSSVDLVEISLTNV